MCRDAISKRVALDLTMTAHEEDIGVSALSDQEWSQISAVMDFLRVPRQVMESLAADRKSSLDLVQALLSLLKKHCEASEERLSSVSTSILVVGMTA